MTPNQESEVLRYLRDDMGARLDKLASNQEALSGAQGRLSNEFLLMRSSMESDFKVFGHRLAGVESRVGNLEHDAETTADHDIQELKKKLEKQNDQGRDTMWRVIALVGAFGGGSVMAFILSMLLRH
jgi:hypothetical protein